MNSKINESFSVEKKIISDEWKNDDMPGLHIKQAVVVEKFSEKPIYVTNTGTEIASWELPGLPRKYLDAIGFNRNASFSEIAEEGYTSTHGIYLKPINRSEVQYIHNVVNKDGLTCLIRSLFDSTAAVYNSSAVSLGTTDVLYPLNTGADGPSGMDLGTGVTNPDVDDAGIQTSITAFTGFLATWPQIQLTDSNITQSASGATTGLYDTIEWKTTWLPGAATNSAITEVGLMSAQGGMMWSRIEFAPINKQTADTLNVTIKWVLA